MCNNSICTETKWISWWIIQIYSSKQVSSSL